MSFGGSIEVADVPSWMTVAQCNRVKDTGTLIVMKSSTAKEMQKYIPVLVGALVTLLPRTTRILLDALRAETAIVVDEASLTGVRDGKFATDVSGFLLALFKDTRVPAHTIILAGTP